jgi:two-component system, NarL family, nitrate/nitrite response regulator NarL
MIAILPPIELLIVDDHSLFRRGLTALLSQDGRFHVAAQAADIGEALRTLARQSPDVILLDNHLPGVRGVEGIPALKEAAPEARILMLTVSENEDDLAAALQAGAEGYLLKTVESDQLGEAIVKVMAGESVVSTEMMTKLVTAFRAKPAKSANTANCDVPASVAPGSAAQSAQAVALAQLSAREREVLVCIARGDSNKVIARQLDIAETTVKIHVQHILRKLQLNSRVQVAVYATALDAV